MVQLPVVSGQQVGSAEALVRAVKRAEVILARTVAEEATLEGCTVLSNGERGDVRLANFVAEVAVSPGGDGREIVDQVQGHFRDRGCRCWGWRSAGLGWDESLVGRLSDLSYVASTRTVYRVGRAASDLSSRSGLQILPARSVYGLLRTLYAERAVGLYPGEGRAGPRRGWVEARVDLLDEPRFDLFLARSEGQPVGVAGVVTLGQVGVLDGLCVAEGVGESVAKDLLVYTLEHCARSQFEQVVVELGEGDPWREVYESVGFESVASFTNYDLPPPGPRNPRE